MLVGAARVPDFRRDELRLQLCNASTALLAVRHMRPCSRLYMAAPVGKMSRSLRLSKLFSKELKEKVSRQAPSFHPSNETSNPEVLGSIKAIISKANLQLLGYGSFKDPANASLDLKKSNRVLYDHISQTSKSRMQQRYRFPSKEWADNLKSRINLDYEQVSNTLQKRISKSTISPQLINKAISVGDIVTLNESTYELYIVIRVIDSLDSGFSYTFVNHKGEIVFAPRGSIKIRVPAAIHDKYDSALESIVQFEHKQLGIQPIGVPDNKFSKSKRALPNEIQGLFKPLQVGDAADLSIEDSDSVVVDDLVVAQASSQMLTDTAVNTYIVPLEARKTFARALKQISMGVYDQIPVMSAKLRTLHQRLQYDEVGDVIDTPRTLSVFDLLHTLSEFHDDPGPLQYTASEASLGKPLKKSKSFGSYPIADYLAMIIALKQQPRSWSIDRYTSSFPPSSVTIIPAVRTELSQSTVKYLKTEKGSTKFIQYCVSVLGPGQCHSQKPPFYKETIEMFKDYIVSNISGDFVIETTLVSILRGIDSALGTGASEVTMYKNEYSKARAYDLLKSLNACDNLETYVNPAVWSNSLRLPNHNISMESDLSQQYYDYVDFQSSQKSQDSDCVPQVSDENCFNLSDPVLAVRQDLADVPVYCIDSASAHEIDDGISIHESDGQYVVTVHVANPTSYLGPDSVLSSIAFSRASTSYMPEGPLMMFPKMIADLAGLGIDGRETRTLTVEFQLSKDMIDNYIEESTKNSNRQLKDLELHDVLDSITKTAKVSFSTVRNFPQGFTYKHVNDLLNNEQLVKAYHDNKRSNVDFSNLYKLFHISNILQDVRLVAGDAIQFNSPQSQITIEKAVPHDKLVFQQTEDGYSLTPADSQSRIKIDTSSDQAATSKSQLLVSHCMIFANFAAATYAHRNGIEIIHRTQVLNLSPKVVNEIQNLYSSSAKLLNALSDESVTKLLSIITKARYQVERQAHDMLGFKAYTNVTSPLRRFVDMINHWQFEKHASIAEPNSPVPKTIGISLMASHLLNKEVININVQQVSSRFWEGTFLKEYLKIVETNQISKEDLIKFQLTLKSNLRSQSRGTVGVLGFNNLSARVELTKPLLDDFDKNIVKVGDVLDPARITLTKVDYIENDLVFEYR